MKNSLLTLLLTILLPAGLSASAGFGYKNPNGRDTLALTQARDSSAVARGGSKSKKKRPMSLSMKYTRGGVFKTNDFVSGDYKLPAFNSGEIKFAFASAGDNWKDLAYGMPYYGAGFLMADYHRKDSLGRPIALYLFQGANIVRISPKFHLNYELNLGVSFGWKPYDPFKNPNNVTVGSKVNAYVGIMVYLKWLASKHIDINIGGQLTHFSNGATRMPNKGLNSGGIFVEAVYNINRAKEPKKYDPLLLPPKRGPRYVSDILVNISSRQEVVEYADTERPTEYIDRKFTVLGLSYACLRVPNHRFRYGLSADLIYDESSGVKAWRQAKDGEWYERVEKGKVGDRFSFGISAKGEITQKYHSLFANVGYDIIHGNKIDHRFYQVIGVKVCLKENLFGTFGIRATHFSNAQFLYWSLGYTIDHNWAEKRKAKSK